MAVKIKRTGKDSVFCHLFSQDEYILELYKTLHPEDASVGVGDIEVVTIERVLTDGDYNDLGFTVGSRLMVLVEAQSTWSANIVTRMLLYIGETYRRHLEKGGLSLHESAVVGIPAPELYVIYTGPRDVPDEVSFVDDVLGGASSSIEVKARVLHGGGADVVGQYVECAHVIDEVRVTDVPSAVKAKTVVETCIERGILVPYFESRRLEVTDIMFTLFDQERETRLYHERLKKEAVEQGLEQGIVRMAESLRTAGVDESTITAAIENARKTESSIQ